MRTTEQRLVVFAQSMRRSGTTIVFDVMLEDGSFECFCEPLGAAPVALGDGCGAHADKDLSAILRSAREEFLSLRPEWLVY